MKYRTILAAAMVASLFFAAGNRSEACTNVIVTRGASADGSCLVSYAADSHWLYGELYFKPQAAEKVSLLAKNFIDLQSFLVSIKLDY